MTRSSMMTLPLAITLSIPVIMDGVMIPIIPMDGDGDILTIAIIHPLHGDLADIWAMGSMIPIIMDITMVITADTMVMEVDTMTIMT